MSSPAAARRHSPGAGPASAPGDLSRQVDALLFAPAGWFLIDARNRRLAGVTPGTLDQALALVGRGQVASVVGRLRAEVAGVDIDADGSLGDIAAQTLRDWCAARGLWHLLRPSGGGPGRWHLLAVPGVHRDALTDLVGQLRHELGLSPRRLALRTHLRPLSAPHRRCGTLTHLDGLEAALPALKAVLEPLPARIQVQRAAATPTPPVSHRAGGPPTPLTPLARPRRELPAAWASYLTHGRTAAAAAGADRDPDTRSQLELEATFALVIAGYNETDAWTAISASHPTAYPKARERGRTWWWWVWNRAVLDADSWLRTRRQTTAQPAPQDATTTARAALEALWRSWPARTHHVDRELLTVVLDLMDRRRTTSLAIAQRELVLESAICSRTTVRAALARLQAAQQLVVLTTYQPGTTDTSHTLQLPPDPPPAGVLSPTDPHGCQPPHRPPPPLALRRTLGLPACAVLSYLPGAASSTGQETAEIAVAAGLLEPGQHIPTERQLRTVRDHLQTLARHELAVVDEHGGWRLGLAAIEQLDQLELDPVLQQLADTVDAAIRERIGMERQTFRAAFDATNRRARWERQRHTALARHVKNRRAQQRTWWCSLTPDEQDRRRAMHADAFVGLPPAEQAQRKQQLASQRADTGHTEAARHQDWLSSQPADQLAARSTEKALAFARRPTHEQQHLVASWISHRRQWGLPHHTRIPAANAAARRLPEAELLHRQPPTPDELVLFDLTTHTAHRNVVRDTG